MPGSLLEEEGKKADGPWVWESGKEGMKPRAPQGSARPPASLELVPGSLCCSCATLAPACLTQSPPAAKPGPHLGVILRLTSSRHLGLFGLISGSFALTLALTQLIPALPWLPLRPPRGADHEQPSLPVWGLQAPGLALTGS